MADKEQTERAKEILDMFASVPIDSVKDKMLELWNATRTVSMGRDREPVIEPDTAIQLKVWLSVVESGAGQAFRRKPVDPTTAGKEGKSRPAKKGEAE